MSNDSGLFLGKRLSSSAAGSSPPGFGCAYYRFGGIFSFMLNMLVLGSDGCVIFGGASSFYAFLRLRFMVFNFLIVPLVGLKISIGYFSIWSSMVVLLSELMDYLADTRWESNLGCRIFYRRFDIFILGDFYRIKACACIGLFIASL